MGSLPASRLSTFASELDPPGSAVVGVAWGPGGTFTPILDLRAHAPRFEVE